MSVAAAIAAARSEGRAALVGYLPAGFPGVGESATLMTVMAACGVDAIEIGFPYSDPVMDGPTIQRAAEVALANRTRSADVLQVVEQIGAHVPALVMTYWNPIERMGVAAFAARLAAAGGAGLITPDLIPDEASEWTEAADAHGLDKVFLVAPSSTTERLISTAEACRGFIYATSVMGVTGTRDQTSRAAPELVSRLREVTGKPVGVGLGVSSGRQAADVASYADAVIVGSAFVRAVLDASDIGAATRAVEALATELARGVRGEL